MTNREFLERVIATATEKEIVDHATAELGKLDAKNASKRAKNAEKAKDREPIAEKLLALLEDASKPLSVKELCDLDASLNEVKAKIPHILGKDLAEKVEIVKGKAKDPNAYRLR